MLTQRHKRADEGNSRKDRNFSIGRMVIQEESYMKKEHTQHRHLLTNGPYPLKSHKMLICEFMNSKRRKFSIMQKQITNGRDFILCFLMCHIVSSRIFFTISQAPYQTNCRERGH